MRATIRYQKRPALLCSPPSSSFLSNVSNARSRYTLLVIPASFSHPTPMLLPSCYAFTASSEQAPARARCCWGLPGSD
eukprot:758066-Hanusia_phi.AAC.5